jgi:hypothetical protein
MLTPNEGNFPMDMVQSLQVSIEKHLKSICGQLENIDGWLKKLEDNQKSLEAEVRAHSSGHTLSSARPGSPKRTRVRITPTSLQVDISKYSYTGL